MLDAATLRKLLKGEKKLSEVKPGLTATQHILHLALETHAKHGNSELWNIIETEFDSLFTLDDFIVSPNEGDHAGITGIYWGLFAAIRGNLQVWEYIVRRYGNQLALMHFLASPEKGEWASQSGLWWALRAAAYDFSDAGEFIIAHFGEQLALEHFLTAPQEGKNADKTGLWWALNAAACGDDERGQIWEFIAMHFGKQLTLEHFLTAPKEGENAGISGLWWALLATANGRCPQICEFIFAHFGNQLRLEHFLMLAKEGDETDESGFWLALKAAAHDHPQKWNFIEEHFGEQLTLEHFLSKAKAGEDAGRSGVWLALIAALKNQNSPLAFLCNHRFINQLKVQHIEQTASYDLDFEIVSCSVLHLLCKTAANRTDLVEYIGQILINNADAVLKIDSIMSDKDVSADVKSLLEMHQKSVKLKADVATGVKEDVITAQTNALVNDAHQLQVNHQQSAGYFLLAQCVFTNNSQLKERLSCLGQVDENSLFYQEALLEQANLLFVTDCDKEGGELPLDIELKKHARKTALEEALRLVTRCAIEAHLKESYDVLKRRIVAKLLDDEIPLGDREAYRWAVDITDFAILLQRIADEKIIRQEQVINKMKIQLDALLKIVITNSSPQLLMKQAGDLRSAIGLETTHDHSLKGQPKITTMIKYESKRRP